VFISDLSRGQRAKSREVRVIMWACLEASGCGCDRKRGGKRRDPRKVLIEEKQRQKEKDLRKK